MKIIPYQESYSSVNLRRLDPIFWIFISLMILAAVLLILSVFVPYLYQYRLFLSIAVAILFVPSIKVINAFVNKIRGFSLGKKGEDIVAEELKSTLDDNYVYITNYQIPDTKIGDIDDLLIGPKGIIIIEVKNLWGVYRFCGEDMYKRLNGDIYRLFRKSPTWQTSRQKEYLIQFLKGKGLSVRLIAIVVMAGGKISHICGPTGIFITETRKLTNHIFELNQIPDWSAELSNKIIAALNIEKSE